jgi:hypothetical protein
MLPRSSLTRTSATSPTTPTTPTTDTRPIVRQGNRASFGSSPTSSTTPASDERPVVVQGSRASFGSSPTSSTTPASDERAVVVQGTRASFGSSALITNGTRHSPLLRTSVSSSSQGSVNSHPEEEKELSTPLTGLRRAQQIDELLGPLNSANSIREVRQHLNNLRRDLPWFEEIMDSALVPERFNFRSSREWARAIITLYCTLAASVLYLEGGSKEGLMYVIGSIVSNGVQTAYYTNVTLHFLSHLKDHKKIAGLSGVLALFATIVSSIATFQLSDDSDLVGAIKALLNASGNMPQNLYGMFSTLKSLKNYFEDNPKARHELLQKFRNALDGTTLQVVLKRDRSMTNSIINQIVGIGFGIALSAGQAGYIRSSVSFMTGLTGNSVAGLGLGFLTNLPTLAISMFISGNVLADGVVNQFFDIMNDAIDYAAGRPIQTRSPRESGFMLARLFSAAGLIYLALFSGATSKYLYNHMPELPYLPSSGLVDDFLEIDVDQGAQLFNSIMSILSWFALLDYLEKAYVNRDSFDYAKYQTQQMEHNINQLPTESVERLAESAGITVIPQRPFYAAFFSATPALAAPDAKPEQEDGEDLSYHRLQDDTFIGVQEDDAKEEAAEPSIVHEGGFVPRR